MDQRFLLIANPIAGGGRGKTAAPRLRDALVARGCEVELYFTAKASDGATRARSVAPEDYTGVIAVGGDGTLNEVLNGLPDPSVRLGILAVGTANVMAMELDLPRDPVELAKVLVAGRTQEAAVGLVDERRFLLFVSSGIDASVVQRVDEVRTGTQGKLKYIPSMLHVGREWKLPELRFTTIEGATHEGFTTVVVTRVRGYAGVMKFPRGIHLGDGKLHVIGFRQRSRLQYLFAFARGIFHRLREDRDVFHVSTSGVHVESTDDDAPWQVDGEFGGRGSVDVRLDPDTTRLFVP